MNQSEFGTPRSPFAGDNPYRSDYQPEPVAVGATHQEGLIAVMRPLAQAAGWMRFAGWAGILLGIFYCLTISGIIIGWLPIWGGVCLKRAGNNLQAHYPHNPNGVQYAANDLATVVKLMATAAIIVGVLITLVLGVFAVAMTAGAFAQ